MRRLLAAVAIAVGLCGPAAAQETVQPLPRGSAVLTLDKVRVFRQSLAGQQIEAAIDRENEALAAENRQIEAELETEERALTDQRAMLEVAEFQALAEAFNTKAVALRAAQLGKARALEQRFEAQRQGFFQALVPILGAIMQETGAAVILEDKAVILSLGRIDITGEAIRRMDAAAPAP